LRTKKESGYSLVEVMAAIVILTIAIIPMVGMFDSALRAVSTSGDYGVARACAGQKLEQLRSLPYETVSAGLPDGTCEPSGFRYAFHEEFCISLTNLSPSAAGFSGKPGPKR
jgi:prepilin-type N-terminal cleavage/methylation domain-containing protein